jgi:hypothetical protein
MIGDSTAELSSAIGRTSELGSRPVTRLTPPRIGVASAGFQVKAWVESDFSWLDCGRLRAETTWQGYST